jgi:uncharacterized protein with PIN domain
VEDGGVGRSVVVEVEPSLRPLIWWRERGDRVLRDAHPAETVAHVVQSVGVPVTEAGDVLVDGVAVDRRMLRSTRVGSATSLLVLPRSRPQDSARGFLLDVHLRALARRMRLLGLDVEYGPDADDDFLATRSAAEHRVLLTRDRGLLFRGAVFDGALIRHDDVTEQLDDVLDRFAPDLAPWTRCPRCGSPLEDTPPAVVAPLVKPGTRRTYRQFSRCTGCGQVYWRGAHGERLEAIVDRALAARRVDEQG